MKNVASVKTNSKSDSPKTPGGISKSLLTPCRRVGLSRNWRNKGPSPFISPLASNTSNKVELVVQKKETRKRKSVIEPDEKCTENDDCDNESGIISKPPNNAEEIVKTPIRNVELPRKKKSKTFLASLNTQGNSNTAKTTNTHEIDDCTKENETSDDLVSKDVDIKSTNTDKIEQIVKEASPEQELTKSAQKCKKFKSPLKATVNTSTTSENTVSIIENVNNETPKDVAKLKKKKSETKPKTRSPNELTKECIVVIQKKLLKVREKYDKCEGVSDKSKKNSQPLFDSDDEAPLSTFNKKESNKVEKTVTILDDDDDEFIASSSKNKNKKIDSKKTLKIDNKITKLDKTQASKVIPLSESKAPSQSSFDDDDDFFDKKKTILIRKTYDKVIKPSKAKSTGSITQKDIDDLKARIEVKKKMLLARSMTSETEELRSLIKKWQKGCQEAIIELMDLMKIKCPDKHCMDYSEILQMLKIPPSLVGYDSDHDCFNTPDDNSAVLSKYNDF